MYYKWRTFRRGLIFESATELKEVKVGSFNMRPAVSSDASAGPPPAVKAVLSKFSSGKEEDKFNGHLQFLKIGPDLLKFVPGTGDLKTWLEAYRYWNQGGIQNASSMLQLLVAKCFDGKQVELPHVVVTSHVGLLHPLKPNHYWTSPSEYQRWRLGQLPVGDSPLDTAPRVAILLYRKHVITGLRFINDLIVQLEDSGLLPIPIFISGVSAHTIIVRDLLTSSHEEQGMRNGKVMREASYQPNKAVKVDANVNTIGFPLVGGPAGSMEAGRNVNVAQKLLGDMNVRTSLPHLCYCKAFNNGKRMVCLDCRVSFCTPSPNSMGPLIQWSSGGWSATRFRSSRSASASW